MMVMNVCLLHSIFTYRINSLTSYNPCANYFYCYILNLVCLFLFNLFSIFLGNFLFSGLIVKALEEKALEAH